MTLAAFLREPLEGKTPLSKVFWVYGVLGSLLYGALELFVDPERVWLMRLYIIGGLLLTVYVTIGTYRCAANCRSAALARFVRLSCLVTLVILPVLTYLELSGALTLDSLTGGGLPEF